MTIKEVSKFVRSKNAGPFWITMDIFTDRNEDYLTIKNSKNMTKEKLSAAFETSPETLKLFFLDDLGIIKVSIPRKEPQGFRYERDMHAGQQYIPLLDFEL
ncbi:MAG: DUF4387 family protein [Bacillota bacterium]|nr:DUF4387 family protein [Bacillota bacterium]